MSAVSPGLPEMAVYEAAIKEGMSFMNGTDSRGNLGRCNQKGHV